MIIKSIQWIDEEIFEASIIVEGERDTTVRVFCHPCHYTNNEKIISPLFALFVKNIIKNSYQSEYISSNSSGEFGYDICGILLNKKEGTVKVKGLIIDISDGYIPDDVEEGDMIELSCSRLDV